jgi:hypothetical protein
MNEFHKELLNELVETWSVDQVDDYILQLTTRMNELNDWLKSVQMIRRKKMRNYKKMLDTGVRGGT